jgi:hypothetical protein
LQFLGLGEAWVPGSVSRAKKSVEEDTEVANQLTVFTLLFGLI